MGGATESWSPTGAPPAAFRSIRSPPVSCVRGSDTEGKNLVVSHVELVAPRRPFPIASQGSTSSRVKVTEHPPGHPSRVHRQGRGQAPRLAARLWPTRAVRYPASLPLPPARPRRSHWGGARVILSEITSQMGGTGATECGAVVSFSENSRRSCLLNPNSAYTRRWKPKGFQLRHYPRICGGVRFQYGHGVFSGWGAGASAKLIHAGFLFPPGAGGIAR